MRIVIIGGVAAGASAAARARRLDENAEIIVVERGEHVSFANCGLPYHVGGAIPARERLLLQTPASLKSTLNIEVRIRTEAVAIDPGAKTVSYREVGSGREYCESYDRLLLAPGATPVRPPLPGIGHAKVLTLRNVSDMDRIKAVVDAGAGSAVVIGGGYIGVEMAENLRLRGLEVDVVELLDQVMAPLDREMARDLEEHMRLHGVRLHLGAAAAAFDDASGRVRVQLKNGPALVADLAIMAVGVRPETALARAAGLELGERGGIKVDAHMRTSAPDIYAAGDAVEVADTVTGVAALVPLAGPANRQGRIAADNICGRDACYTTTQGTAVVKVFDMTGGCTGASEKTLRRTSTAYRKLYLHPSDHAGYYPGAAPMHLKVLFAPDNGRLLGAQATGFAGVDKRLDVLATAIRAGMGVRDLTHLELAYAPPYGAAKDPVNMAGFIGTNMLDDVVEFWYPEEVDGARASGVIVDVRSEQEFELGHIAGAVNVPLSVLRRRPEALPGDGTVYVYCKVGYRSYLAYRLLRQRGASVKTLAGGFLTYRSWHGGEGVEAPAGASAAPVAAVAVAPAAAIARPSAEPVELDCRGLPCPGPIKRVAEAMAKLRPAEMLRVTASDPGFAADLPAWCRSRGAEVVELATSGGSVCATIRKAVETGAPMPGTCSAGGSASKKTMVVFSGDLDRVMASFIIANGAVAMGSEVTMFFTFWGLNALRRARPPAMRKPFLDRMFGWMMPRGAAHLKLSKLNLFGVGTAMMRKVMRDKNVQSLAELVESARQAGVKMVACTMSMDVMGISREELIDGIELGGVAAFLGESDGAGMTLFV